MLALTKEDLGYCSCLSVIRVEEAVLKASI
jgi:hypothetical protein